MKPVDTEFLPAALEICSRPPHPLARALLLALGGFIVLALLWSVVGQVDIVAIAEGRIIPTTRVQQVQPSEKGVVEQILVREGQQVQAGDVLLVLDRTQTTALRNRLAGEWQQTVDALARDTAFLHRLEAGAPLSSPIALQAELEQQWQHYQSQREALQAQQASREAERAANQQVARGLRATLALLEERSASLRHLAERKLVAHHQYLEQEQQRITRQQELAAAEARDRQLQAAIQESAQQLAALQSQVHATTLAKVNELQHQRDSLAEQLRQAQDADSKQVLHAPVSGQVKDLAVHTVGGVVQEAQQLMLVVPDGQPLEVEAWLPNRDIGFIHEGDRAVVKVHTFPFTKYGTLSARVLRISDDAVADEQPGNARKPFHYRLLLQLEQSHLAVGERLVPLLPGMQVTAEVITGQRRIIEFFLSPLQQRVQEGLRER